jgi:hypothetical protein
LPLTEAFFFAGAAVFILLGLAHGILTLRDLRSPRSFTPIDERVRHSMAEAPLRLAPQTTIWSSWLGFNLSHSLGLVVFGALLAVVALRDFSVVAGSPLLRLGAVIVALAYVSLALRFWFWVPAALSAVGTVCFVISALSG